MYPTIKKWLTTKDGYSVSVAYVERPEKNIICFPSQIGCNIKCPICISSTQKFIRSLTVDEMIACCNLFPNRSTTLYSCMGQGEPFENLKNVIECFASLSGKFALSTANPTVEGVSLLNDFNSITAIKVQGSMASGNDLTPLRYFNGEKEINLILTENLDINKALETTLFVGAKTLKLTKFNPWDGCSINPLNINIELYATDGVNLQASCGQQFYTKM